ncbi:MAG: alkaline phosphatase family protein [Clostridiales bacterium]|nr:alkaline phosphatase family protein [Clostridiales bacterium]
MPRILVMSADAMVFQDTELLRTLPGYKKYLAGGSEIKSVRSIYPTVTYPAHVTMATGAFPEKHGVISNFPLAPNVSPAPWNWFHEANKCDDIFSAAKRAGYSTSTVFWPVTACHPDIDYLIPEYWTQSKTESVIDAFRRAGSDEYSISLIKEIEDRIKAVERTHPGIEYLEIELACRMIREKKPEVMLLHPGNIDGYRHAKGLFGEHVDKGIRETDEFISMLGQALEDAGVLEDTDIFLVSDHGQLEIKRAININCLLADRGLMEVGSDGKILSWKAYCASTGMSAHIYLSDPEDKRLYDKVYALLCELRDEGVYGFSSFMTRQEAIEKEHLDGPFSFVIETDGYTSFGESPVRPLVRTYSSNDYRFGNATHGYHPDKGPQPFLIAKGPHIAKGVVLEKSAIVHQAPTYAKILGVELRDAQGKAIEEILR